MLFFRVKINEDITVTNHIDSFLLDLAVQEKKSLRTQQINKQVLSEFQKYLGTQKADVTSARAFIRSRAPKIKASTQALLVSVLRQYSRWLQKNHEDENKTSWLLKAPKLSQRIIKVFSEEDVELLLKVIDERGLEQKILFHLLYGSALRISEALGLKWKDVDLKSKRICVLGKGSKWRWVPITNETAELLGEQQKRAASGGGLEKDSFWHGGIDYQCARKWVDSWGYESGLSKELGSLNPHRLRHALASHMLRRGARLPHVQKMLGHKKLATTERYTHLDINDLIRIYDESLPKKLVE